MAGFTVPEGTHERLRMPIVRARILEDTPAAERAALYARAAHLAYQIVADDEDIARLLLEAPPIGEPWAVHALRGGYGAALRRGDFARAATYLHRALDEPQDPLERAHLGLDLAGAEAVSAPEAGDRRLMTLVQAPDEGEPWAQLRVRALDMGLARGDDAWGRRAAAHALATAHGSERDELIALYWYAAESAPETCDLPAPGFPTLPEHPLAPAQAGVRAWQLAARGRHRARVAELARRALDAGNAAPALPRLAAVRALWATDAATEAEDRLATVIAELRRRHSHPVLARALALSAELHLRGGRLDAADRAADAAERALPSPPGTPGRLAPHRRTQHHRPGGPPVRRGPRPGPYPCRPAPNTASTGPICCTPVPAWPWRKDTGPRAPNCSRRAAAGCCADSGPTPSCCPGARWPPGPASRSATRNRPSG